MANQVVPDYLSNLHPHIRDSRISFDPIPHTYTIDNDPSVKYTSVTTWNHSHFGHFDADKIIDKMMASKNWPSSKYYGLTREEIKAQWDKNRDGASGAGTNMHYDIECFYNECPNHNESIEYKYFLKFVADHPNLKAYRTEWMVFHEELQFQYLIDMVFENLEDGTLSIYDWKRCKEIKKAGVKCSENPVIDHLPDTNYWHYCLQLNTYKAILESKYGKTIRDLYLVCLHPENKNKSYQKIKVVDLQEDVKNLFAQRLELLGKK